MEGSDVFLILQIYHNFRCFYSGEDEERFDEFMEPLAVSFESMIQMFSSFPTNDRLINFLLCKLDFSKP